MTLFDGQENAISFQQSQTVRFGVDDAGINVRVEMLEADLFEQIKRSENERETETLKLGRITLFS